MRPAPFAHLELAAPDAVLGVAALAAADPRIDVLDLSVGGYRNAAGYVPLLRPVAAAYECALTGGGGRGYAPPLGPLPFRQAVVDLLVDEAHSGRAVSAQAVGGTGALRLLLETLARDSEPGAAWISDPGYPNHLGIARAAGYETRRYEHVPAATGIDVASVCGAFTSAGPGDVVILHASCHNPTGIDPTPIQWQAIASVASSSPALAVLDLAYFGYGTGPESDRAAMTAFAEAGGDFAVCVSFSKSMVLAGDRVGAIVVVASSPRDRDALVSQLTAATRTAWSSPPRIVAEVVTTVLEDQQLRAEWRVELASMSARITDLRRTLRDALLAHEAAIDTTGLVRQSGLFWLTDLDLAAVQRLREDFGVYILDSGRMNLAAVPERMADRLAEAMAAVTMRRSPKEASR